MTGRFVTMTNRSASVAGRLVMMTNRFASVTGRFATATDMPAIVAGRPVTRGLLRHQRPTLRDPFPPPLRRAALVRISREPGAPRRFVRRAEREPRFGVRRIARRRLLREIDRLARVARLERSLRVARRIPGRRRGRARGLRLRWCGRRHGRLRRRGRGDHLGARLRGGGWLANDRRGARHRSRPHGLDCRRGARPTASSAAGDRSTRATASMRLGAAYSTAIVTAGDVAVTVAVGWPARPPRAPPRREATRRAPFRARGTAGAARTSASPRFAPSRMPATPRPLFAGGSDFATLDVPVAGSFAVFAMAATIGGGVRPPVAPLRRLCGR